MRRKSRRLVISLAIVLAWLGFVVQGARALLNDSSMITENTITSGSVDMKVGLGNDLNFAVFENNQVGRTHDLLPGHEDTDYIYVKNDSVSNVALDLSMSCIGHEGNDASVYDGFQIQVVRVNEDGVEISNPVFMSLADLIGGNNSLGIQVLQGEAAKLRIRTMMLESSTSQNVNINYDVVIAGTQVL